MFVRSLVTMALALPVIVLGCSSSGSSPANPGRSPDASAQRPQTAAVAVVVEGMACADT